jgi:hypothetical protein
MHRKLFNLVEIFRKIFERLLLLEIELLEM